MFVNRVSELALLEKHYHSTQAEFFVLYGRRRVGKTELLAHFCEGKPHVFFFFFFISETRITSWSVFPVKFVSLILSI